MGGGGGLGEADASSSRIRPLTTQRSRFCSNLRPPFLTTDPMHFVSMFMLVDAIFIFITFIGSYAQNGPKSKFLYLELKLMQSNLTG